MQNYFQTFKAYKASIKKKVKINGTLTELEERVFKMTQETRYVENYMKLVINKFQVLIQGYSYFK